MEVFDCGIENLSMSSAIQGFQNRMRIWGDLQVSERLEDIENSGISYWSTAIKSQGCDSEVWAACALRRKVECDSEISGVPQQSTCSGIPKGETVD